MAEVERFVRGERFKAVWTGKFGDQTIGIYSKLGPLDSGSEVKVELPAEPLLDKLIIGGNQAQCRVFLSKVVAFAVFLISSLPLLSFFIGREILFWWVVRFGMGGETWFWSGEGRGM